MSQRKKNYLRSTKTHDGYSMGWTQEEVEEMEDGSYEVLVRVRRLDKNCPEESVEERLGVVGNYECPEDHWFDSYRIITDWKYRSIYVVFKYQHDDVWGEDYDTKEFYSQGDSDSRFVFS